MSRRDLKRAAPARDKRVFTLLLILAVLVSLPVAAVWLSQDHDEAGAAETDSTGAALDPALPSRTIAKLGALPPGVADHVQVAYFHRSQRCASCVEAERLTRKTLNAYFADQIRNGKMSLVVADVQNPINAGLARSYGASGSELYLGIVKKGTLYVYPVGEIWLVVGNEARFMAALHEIIDTASGGG